MKTLNSTKVASQAKTMQQMKILQEDNKLYTESNEMCFKE